MKYKSMLSLQTAAPASSVDKLFGKIQKSQLTGLIWGLSRLDETKTST